MSTRNFIAAVLLALLLLGAILYSTAGYLAYFGLFFLALLGLFGMCWLTLTGLVGWEKFKEVKAKRLLSEHQASQQKYITKKDGHGMLHLINVETGYTQNLTIDTRAYRNGHYEVPSTHELAAFSAVVSKGKELPLQAPVGLLGPSESELDLLSIFTQATQSYAVIAGQQVGKTFQARRIAQYWLSSGITPVVIGPKWDKGEWEGCQLYGGEYDFPEVSKGMMRIQQEAESRHADKSKSHKEQQVLPVFFDDWTAIRAKLEKEAEAFIVDATTLYASVNIILYFIIHLDTANAWGVGRVGAALHQNFIKLRIEPGFNQAGLVDRTKNVGYILYPGKSIKDKKQVRLFGGTGQPLLLPDLVIQPNDVDQKIIASIQAGLSYKEVSELAFGPGKFGKFYNDKIDKILVKYGIRN